MGNTTQTLEASFHEKNSLDQLPVLEYTDPLTGEAQSLTQSLAIIEFLEEAYPATHRVLPTSVTERARARQVRIYIYSVAHSPKSVSKFTCALLRSDC